MPTPPPGLSDREFQTALGRIADIVGRQWVFSSDEDVALYRDAYSPLWGEEGERFASAAIAPISVEEIQGIVKVANEYRLPLYPISTGKNLTYGGSAPVYSGSVVLDLKRMNRILEVSERDQTCLVEPGVSYFDLYRHLRQNKLRLWIDTADPGWGGLIGNALDHGAGYTGADFRDHFDAHCGMEVVLGTGEVVRTGLGASPTAKTWQLFKYGMGPWVDGLFSQSNFGIVTKMGFWLMEEPEAALVVSVTAPKRGDIVPLLDILTSLMNAHTIPSQAQVISPLMSGPVMGPAIAGSPDPELVRLRVAGASASDQDWARYAEQHPAPFWLASFSFYGSPKIIAASWEHTKDRLSAVIPGVQFVETGSHRFPLTDEQVEAVADKPRLGIPSLNLFGSRTSPTARPVEGHLDFSPLIPPRGDELLAISDLSAKIYTDMNMPLPFVAGFMFHPRAMIAFQPIATFRNAADNRRSRALFERLLTACAERGWNLYRTHAHFQPVAIRTYSFNKGALHRLHETLKDAIDPNGVISAGRYDIWPKHLREKRA
jgi:4-cresol dehydrogenase (hydroxylating)